MPDIVVDVNGVAYEIQAPMSTVMQLPALEQQVTLLTHMVVREDAQLLYGFYTQEERMMFRSLIKVSGVGPKMALAILSGMAVDEFVRTVRSNDIAALTRMPGVGKKTAERLVVEMKDKLKDWSDSSVSAVAGAASAPVELSDHKISHEAETALIALGYKPAEAARIIAKTLKANESIASSQELIRLSLRSVAQ